MEVDFDNGWVTDLLYRRLVITNNYAMEQIC